MKRQCHGTTKAGRPCKVAPLTGSDYCRAHDPELPAESRFGSPEQARAAATGVVRKAPRVIELLAAKAEAEEEAERLWRVISEALDADRGVVVGNGPTAHVDFVADHPTRLAAFREFIDRVDGKPRQKTEVSGPDGEPITVGAAANLAGLTDEEIEDLRRLVAKVAITEGDDADAPLD